MSRKFKNKTLPRGILVDDGYVFIRIFPNGRRFSKCIGPASQPGVIDDAILKLNHYREQIRLGKFGLQEKDRRITAEQAADIFWELHASQLKSAYTTRFSLNNFKRFFAGRYIDDITSVDMQKYRTERLRSVSPSSVNKERTVFVTLFNKLKEWKRNKAISNVKLPEENPASEMTRANETIYSRKRVLSEEEFNKLLECASPNLQGVLRAAVHTTLRKKDLKALTRDNVNEATNQLEGVQAKTGKPFEIPINSVVRRLIEEAPGRRLLDFTNFRKDFEAAKKQAGIDNLQFKDLRRTGARMMLKKGVDIATVSSYLGHASIRMTQIYVPPSQADKRIASELLSTSYNSDPNCSKNCSKIGVSTPAGNTESLHKINLKRPVSSVGERLLDKQEVVGSIPTPGTIFSSHDAWKHGA
jgi:integrase